MTNTDKWAQLDVAMTASAKKTIKELFAEDKARAAKFTVEAAGWTLDYSKNRIDEKVMKALVKLAKESNLKEEIEKMFTGKKINATEGRAVLHTALRNLNKADTVKVDGKDLLKDVRKVLVQMGDFSDKVRDRMLLAVKAAKEHRAYALHEAQHEVLLRLERRLDAPRRDASPGQGD